MSLTKCHKVDLDQSGNAAGTEKVTFANSRKSFEPPTTQVTKASTFGTFVGPSIPVDNQIQSVSLSEVLNSFLDKGLEDQLSKSSTRPSETQLPDSSNTLMRGLATSGNNSIHSISANVISSSINSEPSLRLSFPSQSQKISLPVPHHSSTHQDRFSNRLSITKEKILKPKKRAASLHRDLEEERLPEPPICTSDRDTNNTMSNTIIGNPDVHFEAFQACLHFIITTVYASLHIGSNNGEEHIVLQVNFLVSMMIAWKNTLRSYLYRLHACKEFSLNYGRCFILMPPRVFLISL